MSIKFSCVTLRHMSIGTGVVRAVALQQIHHAPHAKASAEGNNEGPQSVDILTSIWPTPMMFRRFSMLM